MSRIKFLNTYVDNLTMDEAINKIDELIINKKPSYVVTPNVDHIVKLEDDREFVEVYKEADLILTDGMPLIWISKLKKNPIIEKISGSDLFPEVCKLASKKGYKIFLLGAAEGVAAKAAENLISKYDKLNIKNYKKLEISHIFILISLLMILNTINYFNFNKTKIYIIVLIIFIFLY